MDRYKNVVSSSVGKKNLNLIGVGPNLWQVLHAFLINSSVFLVLELTSNVRASFNRIRSLSLAACKKSLCSLCSSDFLFSIQFNK